MSPLDAEIRDLLRFVERPPIPLESVEPASSITRRFTTAAMSMGALSAEAHEALAEAVVSICLDVTSLSLSQQQIEQLHGEVQ